MPPYGNQQSFPDFPRQPLPPNSSTSNSTASRSAQARHGPPPGAVPVQPPGPPGNLTPLPPNQSQPPPGNKCLLIDSCRERACYLACAHDTETKSSILTKVYFQVIMDPRKGATIITRQDPGPLRLLRVARQGHRSPCLTKELADPILVGTHLSPALAVVLPS